MKREFLDLGRQPIANNFVKEWSEDEFFYDLKVVFDDETNLVSLKDFVKPEMMFNDSYVYNTSKSTPMITHFKTTAEKLKERFNPKTVLEIGSNDGTFISNFDKETCYCVEPCDIFAKITGDKGYNTRTEFWSEELSNELKSRNGSIDLIYAANCVCHIQDLDDCFRGVHNLLSDTGVFVFEDPSLLMMLERCSYDQIYDEHAHIFSVIALDNILRKNGLMIFDVENLSVHGGSNRIYVKKPNIPSDNTITQNYYRNIKEEMEFGVDDFGTYKNFASRVEQSRIDLLNLLFDIREGGGRVISIGATSKSTTIFNYCGINEANIECITDTTPEKQNTIAPGSHIPVVDRKDINLSDYTHAFLGAWNFKSVIANAEREFVENGGKFITHVPKVMEFS